MDGKIVKFNYQLNYYLLNTIKTLKQKKNLKASFNQKLIQLIIHLRF